MKKHKGSLEVPGLQYTLPLTEAEGAQPGLRVLIISGIHGAEFAGIAAARRLAETVKPGELRGSLTIVHPANPQGFFERREYVNPADGLNLGSCFPGNENGSDSERIAAALTRRMEGADFVIDLHSGDVHEALSPFAVVSSANSDTLEQSLHAAAGFGFSCTAALSHPGMPVGCASLRGVPGVMAEMGGQGRWSVREAADYCRRLENCLRVIGVLSGEAEQKETKLLEGYISPKAEGSCCWVPRVKPGARLKKGALIGHTEGLYGENRRQYRAECDCVVLYVVTALAVQKGGSLFALGVL